MREHEVDDALVRSLLRAKYRRGAWLRDDDLAFEELAPVARSIAGEASELEQRRAARTLRDDPDVAEAVLALQGMVAAGELPALREAGTRGWRAALPAVATGLAGALLAAAAVWLLAVRPAVPEAPVAPGGTPSAVDGGSGLVVKGERDRILVAAKRGTTSFRVQPGDQLKTGDVVGLFYSAEAAGHVGVWHLDGQLQPTRVLQTAVEPGVEVALPNNAIMSEGEGCEWFVGVFSADPLAAANVEAQLRAARLQPSTCDLRATVAGARSVRVVPVRR